VHTVDVDWGCAVIRAPPRGPWPAPVPLGEIDAAGGFAYADFERHRASWLDLIATEDFRAILLDAMSAGELSA